MEDIVTGKTRHSHAIGTLDLGNDTVSLDGGGEGSNEGERVKHFDSSCVGKSERFEKLVGRKGLEVWKIE